jgi:hypothetical protein
MYYFIEIKSTHTCSFPNPLYSEIKVYMNLMPPGYVLILLPPGLELNTVPFRGGSARETTGILMWSKLYLLRNRDNREVVVALMDTQVYI